MYRKKVLFCNESSRFPTGYGTYGKEIISRLSKCPSIEIAELGGGSTQDNTNTKEIPWKFYINGPSHKSEFWADYRADPSNAFGKFSFNAACLDFKPDFVCVIPETLIMTENGYRPIWDIKVGDFVLTHKHRFRKVLRVFKNQYDGEIRYLYNRTSNQTLKITPNHPIALFPKKKQTNKNKSKGKIYEDSVLEFMPSKDVQKGDLVLLPYPKYDNEKTIYVSDYLNNCYINNNYLETTKSNSQNILNKVNINFDFGILIGYYLSDGNVNDSSLKFTFHIEEKEFVQETQSLLKSIFDLDSCIEISKTKESQDVVVHSVLLAEFFTKFAGKTINKHIPKEFWYGTIESRKGLIRGLVRGDGYYKINTIGVGQTEKKLSNEIRMLFTSIQVTSCISGNKKANEINCYGDSAFNISKFCGKYDIEGYNLSEISDGKTASFIQDYLTSPIYRNRIEKYKGFVYNLEVEEDNSYVANQICVHNCDIRDFWMCKYQQYSPFRDYYQLAWMPTVDASPQKDEWIDAYANCDAIFAYSEFGQKTLLKQCPDIKFVDVTSPAANPVFAPLDKNKLRDKFGITDDSFIIGTVMRNQRRKLYPDLFSAFRQFLDQTGAENAYLYCHTKYPDLGWDFTSLIQEYELSNRVLFTYRCKDCRKIEVSFFKDSFSFCKNCGSTNNYMAGNDNALNDPELSEIYNLFDIYIQYANSEGFGMPLVEAAQCGLPIMAIDYSAMRSIVDNLSGINLEPLGFYTELETGCKRAVPNNKTTANIFSHLYNEKEKLTKYGERIRERSLERYNWDDTANRWLNYFEKTPIKDRNTTWDSPPKIFNSNVSIPEGLTTREQVDFLFKHVLHKPEWIGGFLWKRIMKDLIQGFSYTKIPSYLDQNEEPDLHNTDRFNIEIAHKIIINLRDQFNHFETLRVQK